jgi:hypothetical protein
LGNLLQGLVLFLGTKVVLRGMSVGSLRLERYMVSELGGVGLSLVLERLCTVSSMFKARNLKGRPTLPAIVEEMSLYKVLRFCGGIRTKADGFHRTNLQ